MAAVVIAACMVASTFTTAVGFKMVVTAAIRISFGASHMGFG